MNFHGGQCIRKNMIDFSVNIPPYDPPEGFNELMATCIGKLKEYPDIDGKTAKKAIAQTLGIEQEQIIIGNGATELIYLVGKTNKKQRILIVEPTFTEYRRAFETVDAYVESFNRELVVDERICPFKLAHQINQNHIDLLMICNPNNPTGEFLDSSFFETLIESVKIPQFKIVIDESFLDFVKEALSSTYLNDMKKIVDANQVFQVRSLTKTFSVAGLRIGYGIANKAWISNLHEHKEPWSVNRFALESIPFFMNQHAYVASLKTRTEEDREEMYNQLSAINGLSVFKGSANFLLIHCCKNNLHEDLIQKGLYIRTCNDFMGLNSNYYRMAVRTSVENEKMIKAIEEALK